MEFYRLHQAEKSCSNWEKNPVHVIFKVEIVKNQAQSSAQCSQTQPNLSG
jgi:hypothetical protein